MPGDSNETVRLKLARRKARSASLFERNLVRTAATQAFVMLQPWVMARNPVMFVTEMGAVLTSLVLFVNLFADPASSVYTAGGNPGQGSG